MTYIFDARTHCMFRVVPFVTAFRSIFNAFENSILHFRGNNIKLISVRVTSEAGALSSRKEEIACYDCPMFNMANYVHLRITPLPPRSTHSLAHFKPTRIEQICIVLDRTMPIANPILLVQCECGGVKLM